MKPCCAMSLLRTFSLAVVLACTAAKASTKDDAEAAAAAQDDVSDFEQPSTFDAGRTLGQGVAAQTSEADEQDVSLVQSVDAAGSGSATAADDTEGISEDDATSAVMDATESKATSKDGHTSDKSNLKRMITALRVEVRRAHAAAMAEDAEVQNARQEEADTKKMVEKQKADIEKAMEDERKLRSDRDAAARGQTMLEKRNRRAEANLATLKTKLEETVAELQQAQDAYSQSQLQAEAAANETQELQAELAELKNSSTHQAADADQKLHDTMLEAAAKVRELEDEQDKLTKELDSKNQQFDQLSAEDNKAKDSLLQETDAAMANQRRAASLEAALEEATQAANKSDSRATDMANELRAMQVERARLQDELSQTKDEVAELQSRVDSLKDAADRATAAKNKAEADGRSLRSKNTVLAGADEKATALSEQVAELQATVDRQTARGTTAEKELERLRDLEERYSSAYAVVKNESDTWHAHADDLSAQLQEAQKKLKRVSLARQAAAEQADAARSQEDEYFDENVRLQQEDEDLNRELKEVQLSSNRSSIESKQLREQVTQLQADAQRQDETFHATWLSNEQEMLQVETDLKDANRVKNKMQAQLSQMQKILTDDQRKTLGLPVVKPAKKAAGAVALQVKAAGNAGGKPSTPAKATPSKGALKSHAVGNAAF